MKFKQINLIIASVVLSGIPFICAAEPKAEITGSNEATVSDDGLGVEIKLDKEGRLSSIKSSYTQPVEFPDARGKAKAYIIAEEKAKANIARFMSQVSSTTRIVDELDSSSSTSTRNKSEAGTQWTKEQTRKVSESLREITTSSASAILRGVKVLRQIYDPKAEEVTVVVGINKDTQRAASELSKGLENTNRGKGDQGDQGAFPSAGSQDRKSKDYEKF